MSAAPDVSLPPEPCITRRGKWLDAAAYYADNFELFAQLVNSFNKDEASCIANAQEVLSSVNIKAS